MYGYSPFNMFSIMDTIFPIFFLLFFGIIIFIFINGVCQLSFNNKQHVLTVVAKLVAKKTNTSRHHNRDNHIHSPTTTFYYATFEVESGDRIEFHIMGKEYGMLVEGDIGKLTF